MEVTKFVRPRSQGDLVVTEFSPESGHCRERVTFRAGSGASRLIPQFAVVAAMMVGALSVATAKAGTGNGAITGAAVAAGSKEGVYVATCIETAANGGVFILQDPDGVELGPVNVGAAFNLGGLSGTIGDGATDWAAGDEVRFTVTAAAADGKYVQLNPAATDGTQHAAGIAINGVTASDGVDEEGDIWARGPMQVRAEELIWPEGITGDQLAAATGELEALGILVRTSG